MRHTDMREPGEIRKQALEDGVLSIVYKCGDGRITMNLPAILPATAGDMKRIISFMDLSARPVFYAEILRDFIAARVDDLKAQRGLLDPEYKKAEISKINAEMKRYISNAAALVKQYDVSEVTDDAAQIKMKAATVYAIRSGKNGRPVIDVFTGWTFEKAGYTFSVYKDGDGRAARYRILFYGLQVAEADSKKGVPAEVTPRTLEILQNAGEKLEKVKATYEKLMIEGGFMKAPETEQPAADPEKTEERAENILKGEKDMEMTFEKDSLTADGKTFPCEYSVAADSGAVLVFAITGEKADGRKEKQRFRIDADSPHFAAAMKAAKQAGAVKAEKKAATKKAAPVKKAAKPAPKVKTEDPAPAPEPVKPAAPEARGPVKEKDFIGKEITGRGWRILFDGEAARTRVIFEGTPEPAAKQAVEDARFFWSPNMQSFNKKLTFKAYRAATKLADVLNEIYAA